jgi:VanZ family protein
MKILLSLMLAISLFANDIDFMENDKQKHIAVSSAIGVIATGTARHYGSNKFEAFMIGVGTSLVVGILKEAYDRTKPNHTEDINDVYADSIGGVVGSAISTQFSWKF